MSASLRKSLYGLVSVIVAALVSYGLLTDNLGVLWVNVLTLAVGFAYAASRATGDRLLEPSVRRAGYVLAPAVVALVGGYVALDVGLWTSLVLAFIGSGYAIANVDPDEPLADDSDSEVL